MPTCAEAKTLRGRLAKNCHALLVTVPLVVEGIEDDDIEFALRELSDLESQVRGTRQLLEQAKAQRICLAGEQGNDS
jgi:hypothetical protein